MSKRHVAVGASLLGLVAAGALSFGQGSATADIAPQAQDIVGVGSDVIQNSVDFLSDGSPYGDPGYNSVGNLHRVFDFDASPDANGRAAFQDPALAAGGLTGSSTTTDGSTSVTSGTGVPLRASAVLAAGESPQERPNGGGAGVTALTLDTGDNIDFVRSPNAPTGANQTTAGGSDGAGGNLKSYIDTVQFADDAQYVATSANTNAPTLSAEALAAIYCKNFTPGTGDAYAQAGFGAGTNAPITTWKQIPGNSTGSADAIIPLRPQDGAGVLKNFQAALASYASGNSCSWSGNVVQVQQNDPTSITSASNPKDAIVVFPLSRFKLLSSSYYPDTTSNGWVGVTGSTATDPATAANKRSTSGGFPANTAAELGAAELGRHHPAGAQRQARRHGLRRDLGRGDHRDAGRRQSLLLRGPAVLHPAAALRCDQLDDLAARQHAQLGADAVLQPELRPGRRRPGAVRGQCRWPAAAGQPRAHAEVPGLGGHVLRSRHTAVLTESAESPESDEERR